MNTERNINHLYPELQDYIYRYCREFQNEEEAMAVEALHKVPAMMTESAEALKNRIVQRIWQQHQQELLLNVCPACGKIARTPQAQQCRFCFHSWH